MKTLMVDGWHILTALERDTFSHADMLYLGIVTQSILPFVAPSDYNHSFVSLPMPKGAHFVQTKQREKQVSDRRRNNLERDPD